MPGNKSDLHEPYQLLAELDEYDHLQQVFRLCSVHVLRNIKTAAVDEATKKMMHSLVCIKHPDFTGTLSRIELTGKAGSSVLHFSCVLQTHNSFII